MPRRTRGEREKKAFAEEEEDDEGKCYYRREGKGGNHLEKENVTIAGQMNKETKKRTMKDRATEPMDHGGRLR